MIKVLWVVNKIFPYPAEKLGLSKNYFGGWLDGLADEIKNEKSIKLIIATVYKGNNIKRLNDGKIEYFLIPGGLSTKYNKKIEVYAKEIIDSINPDILHIHGTEFPHGLSFINVSNDIKKIVSIQGLTSAISKVYTADMPYKEIIRNITLRDFLKRDNIFLQKKNFEKRGYIEKEIIRKCDYVMGRTDWDYANVKAIKNNVKYFNINEIIRKKFYNYQWDINKIERYSLYLSQGGYPIKGLHKLIESLFILKKNYPNVKLYISGNNVINSNGIINKLKMTGYGRYIKKLINKYKLKENIIFTEFLDEEGVINRLLKTHVVVVPSVIENESNSLTEAHIIGIPSVAAFSGGITNRIIHKESGFLYPYTEVTMLAEYISQYFEHDDICVQYGKKAREIAWQRNNPASNSKMLIEKYKEILS